MFLLRRNFILFNGGNDPLTPTLEEEMIEMIREFIMAACVGGSCALLICNLGCNWVDDEIYEEGGVKF